MKEKKLKYLVLILALFSLVSCSKTVVLSDGIKNKEIKVAGDVKVYKTDTNIEYISFQTPKGTKYSIETASYDYVIK